MNKIIFDKDDILPTPNDGCAQKFWAVLLSIIGAIIILCFLSGCKKEKGPPEKSPGETTTIHKCRQITLYFYDAVGNETGKIIWYYTNTRLDSTCNFNPGKYSAMRYSYISDRQRKCTQFDYSTGKPIVGYWIQTLDENGNLTETRNYDDKNKLINVSRGSYQCD